jgi:hypothetical protein
MDGQLKGKSLDAKLVILVAAVVLLLLAGAGYYFGYFGKAPPAQANPGGQASELAFLAAMDKEAQMDSAHLQYDDIENGFDIRYEIQKTPNMSWVEERGDYGSLEGFFGQDNGTDVVCLTYLNKTKCTKASNNTNVAEIASRLKTRLPSASAANANKQLVERLIGAGAIRFSDEAADETIGPFETKKYTYTLDYKNLTVQALISLGVSPNDQTIYSVANWTVSSWVDKKSGRLVKSETKYAQGGAPYSFSRVFSILEVPGGEPPAAPEAVITASSFSGFYQSAEEDYMKKRACLAGPPAEKNTCLKSLAVENSDVAICEMIPDDVERGRCILVVAQTTKDAALCQKAGSMSDDCYMAVVSEIGEEELCKKLKNSSLAAKCYEAKLLGELAVAEKKAERERLLAGRNCANDSGCYPAGRSGQYCAPTSNKGPFADETALQYACLKGVPCGCVEGYCRFKTSENENYTACMKAVEERLSEEFVVKIAKEAEAARKAANQTKNSTMAG